VLLDKAVSTKYLPGTIALAYLFLGRKQVL